MILRAKEIKVDGYKTKSKQVKEYLNDELVCVTIFDPENDSIQATFQLYSSGDFSDRYEYQVIKINTIQSVKKNLNMKCDTYTRK